MRIVHNSVRFCSTIAKSYFLVEAEGKDGKISPQVNGQMAEQFTVGHKGEQNLTFDLEELNGGHAKSYFASLCSLISRPMLQFSEF